MAEPVLVLFSLRECPNCAEARRFLESRGVAFKERDVREEPGAVHTVTKTTGESMVPMIVYGDDVQIGWDEDRVAEMLDDPLPPEEDDNLLAVIEAATAPDADWPTPSAGELAATPSPSDIPPSSAAPSDSLTTVPSSSGTSVVSAEVAEGPSRKAAGCTSPAE